MEHTHHSLFVNETNELVWAYATELPRLTDWFPCAQSLSGDIGLGDEPGVRYAVHMGRMARIEIETQTIRPLSYHCRSFYHALGLVGGVVEMHFHAFGAGTEVTFSVAYAFTPPLIAGALKRVYGHQMERLVKRAAINFKNYAEARHFRRRRTPVRDTTLSVAVR